MKELRKNSKEVKWFYNRLVEIIKEDKKDYGNTDKVTISYYSANGDLIPISLGGINTKQLLHKILELDTDRYNIIESIEDRYMCFNCTYFLEFTLNDLITDIEVA